MQFARYSIFFIIRKIQTRPFERDAPFWARRTLFNSFHKFFLVPKNIYQINVKLIFVLIFAMFETDGGVRIEWALGRAFRWRQFASICGRSGVRCGEWDYRAYDASVSTA